MPPTEPSRPTWAFTDKGKVVACPKGLPEGAVLVVREGETAWRRADPGQARATARPRAAVPGLYDQPEGE